MPLFTFFEKKNFILDLFDNATDIHNHLLPGIDDGAATIEDSLEMLKQYQELGFKKVIATPHIMESYYNNDNLSIEMAYLKLKNSTSTEGIELSYAAEYMMDGNFLRLKNEKKILPLKENKVLVEMSFFQQPNNMYEILFDLRSKHYLPIMAHPERYPYMSVSAIKDLKPRGCMLQLNLLSLIGHYGKNVQKTAIKLLEDEAYDFFGTDAHKVAHLKLIKEISVPKKILNTLNTCIKNTNETFG